MALLRNLLVSMRPCQWYKNLILFAAILFSFNLFDTSMWTASCEAFLFFCMISGGEYLVNDVVDRDADRAHPTKSKRPIASGDLPLRDAITAAMVLIGFGLIGAYALGTLFFLTAISYLLLALAYSFFLKQYQVVDVLTIASGFVVRAVAGCVAIGVVISPWLILCTFFLALLLALGKRRHELLLLGPEAHGHRNSLGGYSEGMIDQLVIIASSVLVMSYSLYTFLAEDRMMMITIPVAMYGIFRYLHLVYSKGVGGEPELLFRDRGLTFSGGAWLVLVILILYVPDMYLSW